MSQQLSSPNVTQSQSSLASGNSQSKLATETPQQESASPSNKYSNLLLTELDCWYNFDYETGVFTVKRVRPNGKQQIGEPITRQTRYPHVMLLGLQWRLTHLIWLKYTGELPTNVIDHIDGDTNNNSRENLRDVTRRVNARNCKQNKNNTSGYRGVYLEQKTGHWFVALKNNTGYFKRYGTFPTIEAAVVRRDDVIKQLGLEFTPRHHQRGVDV